MNCKLILILFHVAIIFNGNPNSGKAAGSISTLFNGMVMLQTTDHEGPPTEIEREEIIENLNILQNETVEENDFESTTQASAANTTQQPDPTTLPVSAATRRKSTPRRRRMIIPCKLFCLRLYTTGNYVLTQCSFSSLRIGCWYCRIYNECKRQFVIL